MCFIVVCGGDQDEDDDSIFNCYFCQKNYKGYQSVAPELEQCLDPFNPDGVQTVQCRGKCYVSSTAIYFINIKLRLT